LGFDSISLFAHVLAASALGHQFAGCFFGKQAASCDVDFGFVNQLKVSSPLTRDEALPISSRLKELISYE
jgi:hypothetical protein